jgi:hypothetical protein
MATVAPAPPTSIRDYIKSIVTTDPATALELALAETDRQRAVLERQREEAASKADVELDEHGRFVAKNLAGLESIGRMYAKSDLVPDHYKNNPSNCAIAAQMAMRCKVDVFLFMQASYIVHGKCGIEGKLVIAMINASGQIKGRIRWKFEGEGKSRKCTAYVVDAFSGETLEQTVTWDMVEAEGWHLEKKSQKSKWMTLPEMMFKYRSATFLARTSFPDVIMGMHTVDELEDIEETPPPRKPVKSLDDLTNHMLGNGKDDDGGAGDDTTTVAVQQMETTSTAETTEPEKMRGLEGVKEMMMAVTDSQKTINDIARGIRKDRILTADEEFQLDEMAEAHKERIRGKSEG